MSISWEIDVAVSGGPSMLLMVKVRVEKQEGKWHATGPLSGYSRFFIAADTFEELMDHIPVAVEREERE